MTMIRRIRPGAGGSGTAWRRSGERGVAIGVTGCVRSGHVPGGLGAAGLRFGGVGVAIGVAGRLRFWYLTGAAAGGAGLRGGRHGR
jgi:hypothetical protein